MGVAVAALSIGDGTGVSDSSGNININGNSGNSAGTGDYYNGGVYITAPVTNVDGNININGNTGTPVVTPGAGSNNYGITTYNAAVISTTGNGSITLSGLGVGTGASANDYGVYLNNGAQVSTNGHDINVYGSGSNGTGGNNDAIVGNNTSINAGGGDVTLMSVGIGPFHGGDINLTNSTVSGHNVTIDPSNVLLSGTNVNATGALDFRDRRYRCVRRRTQHYRRRHHPGFRLRHFRRRRHLALGYFSHLQRQRHHARRRRGCDRLCAWRRHRSVYSLRRRSGHLDQQLHRQRRHGQITARGFGGTNAQNAGISLNGTAELETTSGDITLTGFGGGDTTPGSYGVVLDDGANITTQTGNINVTGTGGATGGGYGNGVQLYNGSSITSTGSGDITLTGTAGAPSSSFNFGLYSVAGTNVIGGALDTGKITLNADSVNLNTTNIQTTNDLKVNATGTVAMTGGSVSANNINIDPTDVHLTGMTVTSAGDYTINPAHDVTLDGGTTITAVGTVDIENTGIFTGGANAIKGAIVKLWQNVGGSIQNAIDAVNPLSGPTTLTLGNGIFAQLADIHDRDNEFDLVGQGEWNGATGTLIAPTSLAGAPSISDSPPHGGQSYQAIVLAKHDNNTNISGLTVDGSSATTFWGNSNGIGYQNAAGTNSDVATKNTGLFGIFAIANNAAYSDSARTVTVDDVTASGNSWATLAASGDSLTFNVSDSSLDGTGGVMAVDYSIGSRGNFTDNTVKTGTISGGFDVATGVAFHGAHDVTISGGTITGNGADSTGVADTGLAYGNYPAANNITVESVGISNVGTGISGNGGDTWVLFNNTITATGTGIRVTGLTDNSLTGNFILSNTIDVTGGDAVDAYSSVNLDIGHNLIGQHGGVGGYGVHA